MQLCETNILRGSTIKIEVKIKILEEILIFALLGALRGEPRQADLLTDISRATENFFEQFQSL